MEVLAGNIQPADSAFSKFPEGSMVFRFSLKSFAGDPFYEALTMEGPLRIPADTTVSEVSSSPDFSHIKNYAEKWCNAAIIKVDTLRKLEQWIPFSHLKREFPIYKFYFGDDDKHELYISSVSGEALQFTNKDKRFWAWLGAIPHWIYFTSLRQDTKLWTDVIVWLSGLGCIMCIAGIIMGIRSYVVLYRKKKKWRTPYKKFTYKWHHILGFFFGIFVFTFTLSGMMSLADVPRWMVKVHNPSIQESMFFPEPVNFPGYKLSVEKVMEEYPGKVKSIEWASFGSIPLYKVVVDNRLLTIDASGESVALLDLQEADVKDKLSMVHPEPMTISLLTEYDNYYVGLTDHLPLPVYKVEVDDADNSTYYINPKNGNTRYFNTNTKVHHWTYQALHSYKTGFLSRHRMVWNILMWVTMIGGTLVSLTGVWLGFRYIKRKIKKLKK